ncbi:uncharacterized protein LOC113859608 [Abrus precatorius]|uniref:Uncharacterized protein LOC113859608 n=1 Tax=Abrus precatorius TaxID=3816 RepID=A0A8B8KW59_ABRPR|nr:uncharacterized protein LOC113859608 [Abrus precatorius]
MAENTRLKELQTDMKKAFDAIEAQDRKGIDLGLRMSQFESQMTGIQQTLEQLTLNLSSFSSDPSNGAINSEAEPKPSSLVPPLQMWHVKLDFPKFDVHFQGLVIPWFQMLQRMNQLPSWAALATAIESQFGPSSFDNARPKRFKLAQTSSISNYYNEFMLLANHIAQARLFNEQDTVGFSVSTPKTPFVRSNLNTAPSSSTKGPSSSSTPSPSVLPPLLPTPPVKLSHPVRRMSSAKQQLRQEKRLCFTCDKKYTWNHRCPNKQHLLFELEEDLPLPQPPDVSPDSEAALYHLSLNAFRGSPSRATLYFQGAISGKPVRVLLDGGSSDSFIQPRLVHSLHLPVQPLPHLKVMVGDGSFLQTEGYIPALSISISGHTITIPVYVLAVSGSEVVIGASWLATLGPHIADYSTGCIKIFSGVTDENPFPPNLPPDLLSVLHQFASVFHLPKGLPLAHPQDHAIPLQDGVTAVKVKPYRYPFAQKTEIERMVNDMLFQGTIAPNTSPFSVPVLLVKKHDVTIKDSFPIPTVDELLDELRGSVFFLKLDLRSRYHQILVRLEDRHKTAFRTHNGLYEWLVMPFGLTNALATFQAVMNDLFWPFLCKFVLVDYLGHLVSQHGVEMDPSKLSAVRDWPAPTTVTQLCAFLGLSGYYHRFIKQYAKIARLLTDLLQKDRFAWSSSAQTAFDSLKATLLEAPILALPDFSKPFVLETDASGQGIAVAKFRHYLLGHHFIIRTDQRSLRHLQE